MPVKPIRFLQSRNALLPTVWRLSVLRLPPEVPISAEHPWKAETSIVTTLGMEIEVSAVHWKKALFPMVVTLLKSAEARDVH